MAEYLLNDKLILLDDEDLHFLKEGSWHYSRGYASTLIKIDGVWRRHYLHRLILGAKLGDKLVVDHINRNVLDNRRQNLRLTNRLGNKINQDTKIGVSGFRGVSKNGNGWVARIKANTNCPKINLGTYATPVEAAKAYNDAARKYFGEYAVLNEI